MSNFDFNHLLKKVKRSKPNAPKKPNLISLNILTLLVNLCAHSRKDYCFPTQDWLLKTLREKYWCPISKRTLQAHLKLLEQEGFIRKQRRFKRLKDGTLVNMSNLYFLCKRAFAFIKTRLKETWHWVKKRKDWAKRLIVIAKLHEWKTKVDHSRSPQDYIALIKFITSI